MALGTVGVLPAAIVASEGADPGDRKPQAFALEGVPADAPLTDDQRRLLDVAMDAASSLPVNPHLKNRSRFQHEVVEAMLGLDQPHRVFEGLHRIDNWRRGAASAELALYLAKRGVTEGLDRHLRLAEAASLLTTQDWRREFIELRIAETRLFLGQPELAARFREEVAEDVHIGRLEAAEARFAGADRYGFLIDRLSKIIDTERYDLVLNAGSVYVELYRANYADAKRRELIEAKLRETYRDMPGPETLEMVMLLSEAARDNGDDAQALVFLDEADSLFRQMTWPVHREYEYAFLARLAEHRALAGDAEGAISSLDAGMDRLEAGLASMIEIYRADALRSMAEGYHAAGAEEVTQPLYVRALDAGALNKNGRPRAEDLMKTCLSLAVHGVTPSPEAWERIEAIRAALGSPW